MNGEMNGAMKRAGETIKIAGFGFRREARLDSLAEALDRLEARYGPADRLAAAESMRLRVQALGEMRGLATLIVPDALLATADTLTQSRHSRRSRGTGSVAEAVALLAAGPDAALLGPRLMSTDRRATAAMASAVVTRDTPAGDTT